MKSCFSGPSRECSSPPDTFIPVAGMGYQLVTVQHEGFQPFLAPILAFRISSAAFSHSDATSGDLPPQPDVVTLEGDTLFGVPEEWGRTNGVVYPDGRVAYPAELSEFDSIAAFVGHVRRQETRRLAKRLAERETA